MLDLTYNEILEMTRDEFYEEYIDVLTERYDNSVAIVQEQQQAWQLLKSKTEIFFNFLDDKVPEAIDKLKSVQKDAQVKLTAFKKNPLQTLDKDVKDMLTDMDRYNKETLYGKVSGIAALIASYTVPPLIAIPGTTEILFTASEVLNFLIEYKRAWSGSNRSAINDFVNKIEKQKESLNADKICNKSANVFSKLFKTIKQVIESVLSMAEGNMVKGYKKLYDKTEKIGKELVDKTQASDSKVGQKTNKFANKLQDVSSELSKNSNKAIKSYEELREKEKEIKSKKKEEKKKLKSKQKLRKEMNKILKGEIKNYK